MKVEPQIVYEGFEPPDHVERRVSSEIEKLERFFGRITSCRVVVKGTPGRRQQGDLYEVSVHVVLPDGREVMANRHPPDRQAHQDVLVAIRDTFNAAQRQLREEVSKLRGDVKTLETQPMATVKALIGAQDHGFLDTDDGRELYFHRNSVMNADFDALAVGDRVTFAVASNDKGPHASTVHVLGKHGVRTERS